MLLKVSKLTKTYGEDTDKITVLDKLSFSIENSEICTVLGPSGSGKSTLLNIVGGLDKSDSGKALFEGVDITRLNSSELLRYRREKIGFVFQFYNLLSNLTAKENIEVCAELSDSSMNIDELLENLDLKEHADKYPNQLSGGQQQRVAFARAIVKNPRLLLCDEPTGALDYKNSKDILTIIEKLNRIYGTTIIIVTHNAAIAEMSNRILYLKDGKVEKEKINTCPKKSSEITW